MKFTFAPESKPLAGYTIKRAIHKGGFGEVYYALSDAGKEVALKLLHDNSEVELRGVSQCLNLKHPNLVTIIDIKQDDDRDYWVIMEYVSGKTLDEVLAGTAGGMPLNAVEKWIVGMAGGLAYLHDRGIVHRDLKPANVFDEHGLIKIGDVGLAKFISESRRNAQTESVGTVYYMAPEVARGHYGHEVDVYSLGVVLYEMITGRVPFEGESAAEILMKHLTQKPDLSLLPEKLRPVVERALEKDPLRRTPSVTQLRDEFLAAVRGREVPVDIPASSFEARRDTPPPVRSETPKPPPLPPLVTGPYAGYADKYVRKWEKKREKYQARAERKAEKYRRRYENRQLASHDGSSFWARQGHFWIRMFAVGVILAALFRPHTIMPMFRAIAIGGGFAAIAYGGYRLFGFLLPSVPAPHTAGAAPPDFSATQPYSPPPVRTHSPQPIMGRTAVEYTAAEYRGTHMDSNTPRFLSLRQRMTELTGSMTFAVVLTAIVTGVLSTVTSLLPDAGLIALFGIVTLVAAWLIQGASKLMEGHGEATTSRRVGYLGLGVALGLGAYWLDQSLLVDLPKEHLTGTIFKDVGAHPLTQSGQPTLVGYALFFGALFALRGWWRQADGFRKKRFRLMSVLLTGGLAFLLSWIWAFPQVIGVVWAVAISAVVHLSSVWVPPAQRRIA
jgi:serine/threonine protein kinase